MAQGSLRELKCFLLSFLNRGLRTTERTHIGPIGLKDGRVHHYHVQRSCCCCWLRVSDPKFKQRVETLLLPNMTSSHQSFSKHNHMVVEAMIPRRFCPTREPLQALLVRKWRCWELQGCQRKLKAFGVRQWGASSRLWSGFRSLCDWTGGSHVQRIAD